MRVCEVIAARAFVIIIVVLLLAPAIGLFWSPAPDDLSQMDAYVERNVAFGDALITLHSEVYERLWHQTGNEQVILGQDGWLFFTDTLDDYFGRNLMTDDEIARLSDTLEVLSAQLALKGISFTFVCAPNKNSVYPEYMPTNYRMQKNGASNYARLLSSLAEKNVGHLNTLQILQDEKENGNVYLKTDTHWNMRGAKAVFEVLMKQLDIPLDVGQLSAWRNKPVEGDLAVLYRPLSGVTEIDCEPILDRRYATQSVMRSLNDMLIRTHSDTNNVGMLILRDSFGEALFPYLANNVGQLVYSRSYIIDETLLDAEDIRHVVLIIAERNLNVLTNSFCPKP